MSQYIFPAVLTIFVGLLLWIVKRERLALEYEVLEYGPFPRDQGLGKYFDCELRNSGNRAIENITYKIELSRGSIDSIQHTQAELLNVDQQTNTLIQGVIPLLNPKERFRTKLSIKDAENDSIVNIEARAVGATARRKSNESLTQYLQSLAFIAVISGVVSASYTYWSISNEPYLKKSNQMVEEVSDISKQLDSFKKQQIEKLEKQAEEINLQTAKLDELERKRKQGEPEREQIVFASLNLAGLSQLLPELMSISGEGLPFWKTGLFLMHSYLLDKGNAKKYLKAIQTVRFDISNNAKKKPL
jgi:hypothetical protein